MTRKDTVVSTVYAVVSVLGKHIRLTEKYWRYICENKHDELEHRLDKGKQIYAKKEKQNQNDS